MITEFIKYFIYAFIIFCLYIFYDNKHSNMIYVKSNSDNHSYLVRNLPDKQEAADLLGSLMLKLETFIDHLEKKMKI